MREQQESSSEHLEKRGSISCADKQQEQQGIEQQQQEQQAGDAYVQQQEVQQQEDQQQEGEREGESEEEQRREAEEEVQELLAHPDQVRVEWSPLHLFCVCNLLCCSVKFKNEKILFIGGGVLLWYPVSGWLFSLDECGVCL
jgi:flagellar motor protein MotB